jgi:HlyD family secretion protein
MPRGCIPPRARPPATRRFKWWILPLGLVLLIALYRGWSHRPLQVSLIQPAVTTITETITSSGRIGGTIETVVGAQAPGIVEQVFVEEGDRVVRGQSLAAIRSAVAEAQVVQAEQAVNTARALLAQQQVAVGQAEHAIAQARAQLAQLKAERELAASQLARREQLTKRALIPRAEYDQARAEYLAAKERVAAAQYAVQAARANMQAAEAGVAVARERITEAKQALRVARRQAEEAVVVAPFAGIVTAINAEPGQAVGAQGVVRLVSTALEIRLEVDESNLADLAVGQTAAVSSSAFPEGDFSGTVSEIGAAVDPSRGTVRITVTPITLPQWLRPGQTVNVNIITHRAVPRLLVPASAFSRAGERSVVFVVQEGRAIEKPVLTRPPTEHGVPVLAGLRAEDRIIANAQGITGGERVRVRG